MGRHESERIPRIETWTKYAPKIIKQLSRPDIVKWSWQIYPIRESIISALAENLEEQIRKTLGDPNSFHHSSQELESCFGYYLILTEENGQIVKEVLGPDLNKRESIVAGCIELSTNSILTFSCNEEGIPYHGLKYFPDTNNIPGREGTFLIYFRSD